VVVDPAESSTVVAFLETPSIKALIPRIDEIWVTHHHHDHTGGVLALQKMFNSVVRISALNTTLTTDESQSPSTFAKRISYDTASWRWGDLTAEILTLPGHTRDHIAFWLHDESHSLLFSGDVLFGLGCGRVFEGTYAQMLESLRTIAQLPESTQIYCAHEYTAQNLEFSLQQEPNDPLIQARAHSIRERRFKGAPTVPLTLSEEKQTNLFLRALQAPEPLEVFTALRDRRNRPLV
jgi:hydroxyacylglutathione hydrolase